MPGRLEEFLFHRRRFGMTPSLAPARRVLDALGAPDQGALVAQVLGSVGKGSASTFLSALLQAHGLRVGTFTSPHLLRFGERIRLDGEAADDEALWAGVERVLAVAPWAADGDTESPPLTFFEWALALAADAFSRGGAEVWVVEAGLGGRWDATTALARALALIGRIDLEHTQILGDTHAAIAAEKAAALRPGMALVSLGRPEAAAEVIEAQARALQIVPWRCGHELGHAPGLFAPDITLPEGLRLGIPGPHQLENAALALGAAQRLLQLRGRALDPARAAQALAEARLEGRWEEAAPGLWLDGAHNPAGVAALATLAAREGPLDLVFTALADRDPVALIQPLLPFARRVWLTGAGGDRASDPRVWAEGVSHPSVQVVATCAEALERAGRPALVCGSLYLVAEAKAWLEGRAVEAGEGPLKLRATIGGRHGK